MRPESPLETFTILTTESNWMMSKLHHRMPVVLLPEQFDAWLSRKTDVAELNIMMAPAPDGILAAHKVGTRVNKPANNDSSLIEPMR